MTRTDSSGRLSTALLLLGLVVSWEIVGENALVARGALPAPSAILVHLWSDRADYGPHILATVQSATIGFLVGNVVAIAAALIFVRLPLVEQLSRGFNIAIFAIPPIAIAPVLVLALKGDWPRIALAGLAVYFPTMTAMSVGLRDVDPRATDVVRAYGGGPNAILRWIRLRSSLPALLGGLQVAAPNAVLGAMLAEFGSGARWGLGTYLLGSLGRADPARLWGIGLVATVISGLAYAIPAIVAVLVTGRSRAVTIAPAPASLRSLQPTRPLTRMLVLLASILVPLLLWWALVAMSGLPSIVVKSPTGVFRYLVTDASAPSAQARLFVALATTIPLTIVGVAAGLIFAFGLATAGLLVPGVVRALMPVALVSQTMPLVALTPLLVLLLGRGTTVTMVITISVTFFPAFVTLARGFAMVPRAAFDLVRAYGGDGYQRLSLIAVPASLPYLFAAAKLAVPRALLGVMIAEWLATGGGLGDLLNRSRGTLDYGMIWSVAFVSVVLSIGLYQLIALAENLIGVGDLRMLKQSTMGKANSQRSDSDHARNAPP
ncbi:ABC transporter permease [Lichenifustis flavocetrariae]|uniref:ABC transporter permease subunit n=1 Tax=Lichenifustis flavocetrariae TaxID=2949735 RepID=A0AA42CRP1_9HYPH|nr:ABC transporter permease subunit [Lichenifustis flavocetrariae]MCW6512692.1 ABC transporter permease subunit [Lichenifustis flavocetrariae]